MAKGASSADNGAAVPGRPKTKTTLTMYSGELCALHKELGSEVPATGRFVVWIPKPGSTELKEDHREHLCGRCGILVDRAGSVENAIELLRRRDEMLARMEAKGVTDINKVAQASLDAGKDILAEFGVVD